MSVNVEFDAVGRVDIVKAFETAKRAVMIFKGLSVITPTLIDDKIVAWAEKVVVAIEPFVHEQWFVELVDFVVSLFSKSEDLKQSLMMLKAVLAK